MFNLGAGEVLVICLVALIVLGPTRLPEAARTVGRVMGELRRISTGFQSEVRDAFQDVDSPSPLDRRRTESKPLAATVEEADRGVSEAAAGPGVAADSPRRRPASANGATSITAGAAAGADGVGDGQAGVAPEVAEALDQISAAFPTAASAAEAPGAPVADAPPAGADAPAADVSPADAEAADAGTTDEDTKAS
jgi:sec-independent protein translocase protein TatB